MGKNNKNKKVVVESGDKFTRNLTLGMVLLVLLTGVFFSFYSNNAKSSAPAPALAVKAQALGIAPAGVATGVPVVDIWEDFQCPVCKKFEELNSASIKQLAAEKKITVVYHLLSFLGPESVLLANAASCAADEGKYNEFHDLLYVSQGAENSGIWSAESLILAGNSIGVSSSNFKKCVTTGKYTNYLANVSAQGQKKKVTATPTIFVDGKELDRNTQYFDNEAFVKAVTKS